LLDDSLDLDGLPCPASLNDRSYAANDTLLCC
jgi:hypothetical protein